MTGTHQHIVKRLKPQPLGAHPCGAHPCVVVNSGVTHGTKAATATKTLCNIPFTVNSHAVVPAVHSNCPTCVAIVANQVVRQ
jgi:hypothetical protein